MLGGQSGALARIRMQCERILFNSTPIIAGLALSLGFASSALAEGSVQLGLTQELVEWGPTDTDKLIKIDILNAGEVINVAAGGGRRNNIPENSHQMRFTILDDGGNVLATHETTGTGSPGKLAPTDPLSSPITNPWRFTPPSTGDYYLAVENLTDELIFRLDVTVTANASINPDPTGASGIVGRVSSQRWEYLAGSFAEADATDADYYILTPGGAPNTNYVWKLDLNNFAGFGFSLRANSRGVDAPDSGFSIPFADGSTAQDVVQEEFDLYINYPEKALPEPTSPPSVQNFAFLDDEGVDNSISPDTSPAVQDSGVFTFTTNAQSGTYEIAIDVNGNGQFGDAGDVRLLGNTVQGANTIPWNGRDNTGAVLPYGAFDARVSVRMGEFHFVADDAETSGGNQDGLTVYRATRGGGEIPTAVFWDDVTRLPATAGGTNNLPDGGLSGTPAGFHTWGNFVEGPLGDKQFIDTWVYGLSSTGTTGVTVADNDTPVPRLATVDLTPLSVPGDTLTLTLNEPDLEGSGAVTVALLNVTNGETEQVTLTETGASTGIFTGTIQTEAGPGGSDNSGRLSTRPGDSVEFRHTDTTAPGGGSQNLTAVDNVLGISITKTGVLDDGGDGRANVGDVINYTFSVTNESNVALSNVRVIDPLVTVSGGPLGSLAAGATDNATFTAQYTLTQANIDAGEFVNTATARGNAAGYGNVSATSDDPTDPTNADPDNDGFPNDPTRTSLTRSSSVALVKSATLDDGGDGIANAGDVINYTFQVTNTGNVTLTNLTLSDPGVTVSGGPIVSLAPGAQDTTTFTATRNITQTDINAGQFSNTATVSGRDPENNVVTDISDDAGNAQPGPDDPTVTPLPPVAAIALIKGGVVQDGGDGQANVGDTIRYTFSIENTGNVDLTNVRITDSKVTVNGGPIANLAVGASDTTTFTADYPLTQADIDAGQVVNTATTTAGVPSGGTVTDVSDDASGTQPGPDDPTITSLNVANALTVLKTATFNDGGDGQADVGDIITYQFTVTNSGASTLTNVTITDPLVALSGGPIATLSPGASDSTPFTAQYALRQTDIDAGQVSNSATASAQTPGGGTISDLSDDPTNPAGGSDDPTITTLTEVPSLSLTKIGVLDDGGDGVANAGDEVNYSFTVTNTGNVTLQNLVLTDTIATVSGGPLASLAPGQTDSTTFTARYPLTQANLNAGQVDNQASIAARSPAGTSVSDLSDDPTNSTNQDANGDGEPDDVTVTPLGSAPRISLLMSGTLNLGPDNQVSVGDLITYDFTVTNTGNVPLSNISVTDPRITMSGGPITLNPGQSDTTTFTATYALTQMDINAGRVTNTATVQGTAPDLTNVTDTSDDPSNSDDVDPDADGDPDDPTITLIPTSGQVELVMAGILDTGPDGIANVGDVIRYSFTVTNTGPTTLTNLTLDDPDSVVSGGPIATLNPGEDDPTTFTAIYTLTQTDLDQGQVTNTATVSGQDPAAVVVTDISDDASGVAPGSDDPTITSIPQVSALRLEKTGSVNDGGDGFADVGDTVTYSFTVRNVGTVTLTNITVSDPLAPVSGGPIAALVPGASDSASFTATYTLTAADLSNGAVQNVATASGQDPDGDPVTAVSDDPSNPADQDPDGDGQPSDPTVTSLVLNAPPTAVNDNENTPFGTPLTVNPTLNDTDPEGDDLTVTSVGPVTNGTAILNPDGTVTVTPDPGFLGVVQVPYTVCDTRNNCATGQLDVTVEDPLANLSGTVFLDTDLDGALSAGEPGQPTWQIELLGPDGSVVTTTTADASGNYAFSAIDIRAVTGGQNSAPFRVQARHPNTGVTYRISDPQTLSGGTNQTDVNLPVDPIGVIYDSVNRVAIPGTIVTVQNANGAPLPAQCFQAANQQSQETGPDGQYYFDIVSGADAACPAAPTEYLITLTSPPTHVQGVSTILDSVDEAVDPPSGIGPFPVVSQLGVPGGLSDTTHHYSLTIGVGERKITRNNLPLDPGNVVRAPLILTKTASVANGSVGSVIPYQITVRNPDTLPYSGIDLVDLMPAGITLVPETLMLDGLPVSEDRNAAGFVVRNLTINPNQTVSLQFAGTIGAGAQLGVATNQAVVRLAADGRELSNVGEASVRILASAEFDCAEVIGKVFDDRNRNGLQDIGEDGLPGTRLATVKGLLVTTDEHGRYHIACAAVPNASIGSNFILKLDPRTLPTGYRMVSENPRVIRLTRGKMSRANFAVSLPRVVTLDLEHGAFVPGQLHLEPHVAAQLPALFANLGQTESTLRLNYHAQGDGHIGDARLKALSQYISSVWTSQGAAYELSIERQIVGASLASAPPTAYQTSNPCAPPNSYQSGPTPCPMFHVGGR
ncbi:MAG: Ig-like domain-containing protein [Pseudomonadota bacterium]